MAEQRRSTFNNVYKFNGKELDPETGLYYYGARYYNPRVSNWLSVDPLSEMTMTPYQYTYQNPINLTDPTGMAAEDPPTKANKEDFAVGDTWHDSSGNYKVTKIEDGNVHWIGSSDSEEFGATIIPK